jgi:hypothetical protein
MEDTCEYLHCRVEMVRRKVLCGAAVLRSHEGHRFDTPRKQGRNKNHQEKFCGIICEDDPFSVSESLSGKF